MAKVKRKKRYTPNLEDTPDKKPENWTKPTQVGDAKVSVRKAYAKKIGKAGRKKLVKDTRRQAISREVSKAMGEDPWKMPAKALYGDWLGNKKKKK